MDHPDAIRAVALEMYLELESEYGHGIRNGYWPEMRPKLERWALALGLEPIRLYPGAAERLESER